MFATALGYPLDPKINDQHHYKRLFIDLMYTLPCGKCRRHYRNVFNRLPINPFLRGGRASLFSWVLRIHNMINTELGQPQLTASQALRKYFPDMTQIEAKTLGYNIDPISRQSGGAPNLPPEATSGMACVGTGLAIGAVAYLSWQYFK